MWALRKVFSQTKIVLLEVSYIEKWPKFAYLESKVPHLKFRVMRDQVYARRGPHTEALGHCGGKVLDSILSVPSNQPWAVLKTTLIQTYTEFKSAAHSCSHLDNMHQEDGEDLRIYIWCCTWAHKMVTGLNLNENMDPSRWTQFLTSINNTAITNKVLRGKTLPRNLEEAMKKAIQLEAGFQLSKGVNMAQRIKVMQAKVNKVDTLKDPQAQSNHCYGCGELGHFY